MILYKKDLQSKHQIISEFIEKYIPKKHRGFFLDMNAGTGETAEVVDFFHPFIRYHLNCRVTHFQEALRRMKLSGNEYYMIYEVNIFTITDEVDLALLNLECLTLKHNLVELFLFIKGSRPKYFMFTDNASLYYRLKGNTIKAYGANTYENYKNKWIDLLNHYNYVFKDCKVFKNKKAAVYLFSRGEKDENK